MAVLFFFHKTALLFFLPHVWFLLRCFFVGRHSGSFFVVSKSLLRCQFDFNWFHLRFFPPLVMSLWIWISSGNLTLLLNFPLFFLKKTIMEFALWFWFEPFFSRLILIRAFPDDYDTCLFLHIFFARRHSSFGLFLGVSHHFFLTSVVALRFHISPSLPLMLAPFRPPNKNVSAWTSRSR